MNLPKRKATRAKEADYSAAGAYFVTICTKDKANILSNILSVGDGVLDVPQVRLTAYGTTVERRIAEVNNTYSDLHIEQYVIMPNHVHMIILIYDNSPLQNGTSGTPSPTDVNYQRANQRLSMFVSTFKRYINKEIGTNIWQRSFYDHIIRNRDDYKEVCKYIYDNPLKWEYNK